MELWIPITIAAAFLQNLRFMLQKAVKGRLSTSGATFARFVWAAPLALVFVLILSTVRGESPPPMHATFLAYAALGGLTQILATALVVALFSLRNFAIGVSFSKTETVQSVVFGIILLGELASASAILAILISLAGIMLISVPAGGLALKAAFNRPAAYVSYRAASLSLEGGDFLIRAALTLAVVTLMQTVAMWIYLAWREPGEVGRVIAAWRITMWIGAAGMLASLGWFTAMTLQTVAYVRALGQIELLFTFATSVLVFGERSTPREIAGIVLLVAGIVTLLLYR
jgi:drug/metabolite transporter (DMT)-like permease